MNDAQELPEDRRPPQDQAVRARWKQALEDRAALERDFRDPALTFLVDQAVSRVRAAARDLVDGRWSPGPAAQDALSYVWSVHRAPLPEVDERSERARARAAWDPDNPNRDLAQRDLAGTVHAAALDRELGPVLATGAGREADCCFHLSALRELYRYAAELYSGSGCERLETVSERLMPVELAAVYLWSTATGRDPGAARPDWDFLP